MRKSRTFQRGASTVLWAISLSAVAGLAALAVDVNNLFVASAELANAADAGALEGATNLYTEDGTAIQRGIVIAEATAAATANLSRGSGVEVASVEIGHWSFDPTGGGQFTPTASDIVQDLVGKVLYDPADPTSCDNLNNACSGEINAVRVVTARETTPVQAFFARVLGANSFPVSAQAVAYLGYAGSVGPLEVDMPIAICQEAILDPSDNSYSCSVGRFIPTTTETGGWTSLSQDNACQGGTNANELRDIIDHPNCVGGNPTPIIFGKDIATEGGQVQSAFADLYKCWEARTNKTSPWAMTLPVIQCEGKNPGPCNKVVGIVTVNVLYMVDQANKIQDDAPTSMTSPGGAYGDWTAPAPTAAAPAGSEAYGILRWDSFVDHFSLMGLDTDGDGLADPAHWDSNPQLNGWRQKTIYFEPDCDVQLPRGLTSGRNFGIRAEVPVLVD